MDRVNDLTTGIAHHSWNRLARYFISVVFLSGLIWLSPGSSGLTGDTQVAHAASDPVIAVAGDIACDPSNSNFNGGNGSSGSCRQKYTSDLVVNGGYAAVLPLGDNQYYCGGYQAYVQSYDPSWGRVKSITRPVVGNHEYLTSGGTDCNSANSGAAGYFQYFGAAAGNPSQGYYSYDVGAWHLIAINSNCSSAGGCGTSSPQAQWLVADLNAHANFCTLAYWHIPLFSSGGRASSNTQAIWQILYDHNADLVLGGHDHTYERFAPQTPNGTLDTVRGIREFIVGSGGANHTSFTSIFANSEVRNADTFGILKLTLHATSYDWQFIPEAGKVFTDVGTGTCHGGAPDTTPPTAPTNLSATSVDWNQVGLGWTASTDNIGVTGYQVFRNGIQIGTAPGASYVDATVQAQTSYNYYVKAVDGAGLTSTSSNTVSVTTPVQGATLTFAPVADTYVQSDTPTTNYGTATQIIADSSPSRNMFIKFTVTGVGTNSILSAKLRIYCVDASPVGGEFHRVADTSWSETAINWNNAPPADAAILGSLGTVAVGGWYEVDVTSLITGDGTYGLKVNSSSADGAYYSTKEGTAGFAPQLVVTTRVITPTLTMTPSVTPSVTASPSPAFTATAQPALTNTPTVTATPLQSSTATSTANTLAFGPIADTYVQSDTASTNYGTAPQFVTDNSPVRNMYLKFAVTGVGTQSIASAKLRIYCADPSPSGGEFHRVADTGWSETGINWNNAPPADTNILGTLGKVSANNWYEVDVTSLVPGSGTYSVRINSSSADGAYYSTREGAAGFAPQLIVTLNAAIPTPETSNTPSITPTAAPISTTTSSSTPL
ncbi:MAG TPA: DNRLRE domain-containing protein, partial [Anaerolineales bacterium]|nr:DNRLRE domain-containing protein [Anaerolineales bacterium]